MHEMVKSVCLALLHWAACFAASAASFSSFRFRGTLIRWFIGVLGAQPAQRGTPPHFSSIQVTRAPVRYIEMAEAGHEMFQGEHR